MNKVLVVLLIALGSVTACSKERVLMPSQQWGGIKFEVETRPPIAVAGMNEFVIIATRGKRPASKLILSIQIMGSGKWQQATQDGRVGVFRKALFVKDPEQDTLLVRVRHSKKEDKDETILEFPLRRQNISID